MAYEMYTRGTESLVTRNHLNGVSAQRCDSDDPFPQLWNPVIGHIDFAQTNPVSRFH